MHLDKVVLKLTENIKYQVGCKKASSQVPPQLETRLSCEHI